MFPDISDFLFENSESSDSGESEGEFDEEETIKYYFSCGYDYNEILLFLSKHHNCEMSYSTLLRRLKEYGLKRRNLIGPRLEDAFQRVQARIRELVNGPGSSMGYRAIWHCLKMEGLNVPRNIVENILKEIDPEGTELRKKHRLKRRLYRNPGPNHAWHLDGYDKLKPWGFPVHGAIDGFSRKILWLRVTRSNNSPDNIARMYITAIREFGGCPAQLVSDLGTENGLAASIQSYFKENIDAHRYVASPRNQRIEGWWSYYGRHYSVWWRNFFADLESQRILDTSCDLHMECLWYCFADIIQKHLDFVKHLWNTHRIRKSRHDTIPGRPNSLYFLPEHHGGINNLILNIPNEEVEYVEQHILEQQEFNEYQDYFHYARTTLSLAQPTNWEEALALFRRLTFVAMHVEQ